MAGTGKDINPNAMVDPLANIPPTGVKKIARSATFPSVLNIAIDRTIPGQSM